MSPTLVWILFSSTIDVVVAQESMVDAQIETRLDEAARPLKQEGLGFFDVLRQSGLTGIFLWIALLATSVAGTWLMIDSFVTIQHRKIAPNVLVDRVREAMEQGDVAKALQHCADEPGPLANILSS